MLKDIYRVIQASSPVAVGAGLTFAAYIIGILSTGLLSGPIRIIYDRVSKRWLPEMVVMWAITPVIALLSLADRWPAAEAKAYDFLTWFDRWYDRLSRSAQTRASKVVARRIQNEINRNDEYRESFLNKVRGMARYQARLTRSKDRIHFYPFRRWPIKSDDLDSSSDADRAKVIFDRFRALIDNSSSFKYESPIGYVIDISRHGQEIVDELKLVPEQLVGDKPATYERWDRLDAEGEFRQAIVPPLIAITGALLSRGVLTGPIGLLLLVPPIAIFIQGVLKKHEADSQLIQTLEAGVIPSTSLDRLATTTNLHWIRVAGHHEHDIQTSKEIVSEDEALKAKQGKPEVEAAEST